MRAPFFPEGNYITRSQGVLQASNLFHGYQFYFMGIQASILFHIYRPIIAFLTYIYDIDHKYNKCGWVISRDWNHEAVNSSHRWDCWGRCIFSVVQGCSWCPFQTQPEELPSWPQHIHLVAPEILACWKQVFCLISFGSLYLNWFALGLIKNSM